MFSGGMHQLARVAVAVSLAGASAAAFAGQQVNLTSDHSNVQINAGYSSTDPAPNGQKSGVPLMERNANSPGYDDLIDGVQQTYFYRIGATGGQTDINTLTLNSVSPSTPTSSVTLTYQSGAANTTNAIKAFVTYTLQGGPAGSFKTTLSRSLTVQNVSGAPITNLNLFDFSDMALTGAMSDRQANGSYVQNASYNAPDQGKFLAANGMSYLQYDHIGGLLISMAQTDSYGSPAHNLGAPDKVGVAADGSIGTGLAGSTYDLPMATGALNTTTEYGPALAPAGNLQFAQEWTNISLDAAGSGSFFTINSNVSVVPEPGSMALLLGGLGVLVGWRRRKA